MRTKTKKVYTKVCIKCGESKPYSEFYFDGISKKCKECVKQESRLRYELMSKDQTWIDKERIRSREKYNRLGYKDIYKPKKYQNNYVYKNLRKKAKELFNLDRKELHHWNYNILNSFFILSRKAHKIIHKFIYVNEDDFYTYLKSNNKRIDTFEDAISITKQILIENGFNNEDFELHSIDL